jgi:hypothetical protein
VNPVPPRRPPSSPLKAFLDRRLPWLYRPVRGAWERWKQARFDRHYRRLVASVTGRAGWRVQTGPFAGMEYIGQARSSVLLPKLLGTYEDEIHPALEALLATPYRAVVDIGAAEGYYAVGLALRLPTATVFAYDLDPVARGLCQQLAARNGVADRVVVRDRFTPDRLGELPAGRVLVVCDVDGYEVELFTPATASSWAAADLIVELHDYLGRPCRDRVRECLAGAHAVEVIPTRGKVPPDLPSLAGLQEADRRLAVSEIRAPQEWLVATHR